MNGIFKFLLISTFSLISLGTNSTQIEPTSFTRTVRIKEQFINGVSVYQETIEITSNNRADLVKTWEYDDTENGTGYKYYCYGHKHGYCSLGDIN